MPLQKILLILFSLFAWAGIALGEAVLPPEEVFHFSVQKSSAGQYLRIDVLPGYYLYADRLKLETKEKLTWKKPQGVFKKDPYFGKVEIYQGSVVLPFSTNAQKLIITYQGCKSQSVCYPPQRIERTLGALGNHFFLTMLSFAGMGVLLAFTPCVLPMAPILSAMLIGKKNALAAFIASLLYVLGVAFAYALAGMASARLGAFLGVFLQNPWVLSFSALLIALMAVSMLGVLEWRFSPAWQTAIARMSNHVASLGHFGLFVSGALSALILSPCVAPPLAAALTYIAQTGDIFQGSMALFVMGLGMGVPLLLLGSSLGWLLPKSGAFMQRSRRLGALLLFGLALWVVRNILPVFLLAFLAAGLVLALPWLGSFSPKKRLYPVFFVLALLLFWQMSRMKQETNQEAWEVKSLQTSIAKADQPVLLEFYASWCVSCHELEKALEAPGMNALLSRYEVIRIDLSAMNQSHLDLLRHYGLYGPPALVIHEGNHQKGPLVGLPDRKTLHAFLEKP